MELLLFSPFSSFSFNYFFLLLPSCLLSRESDRKLKGQLCPLFIALVKQIKTKDKNRERTGENCALWQKVKNISKEAFEVFLFLLAY